MIGGPEAAVKHASPAFASLAPGVATAPPTEARVGHETTAEDGWLHCGPNGAGHFVKMVHNGIEYGIMAAYAEGFNILKHADAGKHQRDQDAETTPLRDPDAYMYDLDLKEVAEVWRRGGGEAGGSCRGGQAASGSRCLGEVRRSGWQAEASSRALGRGEGG